MIDLELVKAQLRSESSDEDVLIQTYAAAAIKAFETWTNRVLIAADEALPNPVGNAIKIDKAIEVGALMLIAHWEQNRQSVVIGSVSADLPMSTQSLWRPHRWSHF